MMSKLIEALKGHSLAVLTADGNTRVFTGRGVTDLYRLLKKEPQALSGALVADKVVGRAAAALMMLGGVKEVHIEIVSDLALSLLAESAVKISYEVSAPHILNGAGTDWCPLEKACYGCTTAQQCLAEIDKFFAKIQMQ